MNKKVRPGDDFYEYAGGGWLARTGIPKAESRWGTFMQLRFDTEKKLRRVVDELLAKGRLAKGSPEQMVADLYRSAADLKTRQKLGMRPLSPWLKIVREIHDRKSLEIAIAKLHRLGVTAPWGVMIDQDAKDSTKYRLHLVQDGLGMPDREYYLNDDAESKRVRTAYGPYVTRIHRLAGYDAKEAARRKDIVMRVETELAKHSMDKVSARDADKTYHKKSAKELSRLLADFDWKRYWRLNAIPAPVSVIVMQPEFLKGVSSMLARVSLEDWKVYFEWQLVNDMSGVLTPAFVRTSFSFYGTVLTGTKVMKPLWRRALSAVNGNLGELLGKVYVERYFSKEAKQKMNMLVDDLFAAYAARIKGIDWMSPATKKKALKKLSAMNRKIGYPDKWKSYRGLVIRPDDLMGNFVRAGEQEHKRQVKKLGGPIDRGEWFMYPQTVNAYFAPNLNDIVFPAAILQPPFFDPWGDMAVNYGSIGSVIGHEITHGFDDQGSKFDEKGNLKSWWTREDRRRFEKRADVVVKQFDKYTVADGVHVNGKLTLGENIADLGGASIAYDAWKLYQARTGDVADSRGFTSEQRFFLGFSLFEREKSRPEFQKMQVINDPHSPGKFRINGPASNMEEFYRAWSVEKGDKLYRASSERAKIW